MTIVWAWTAGAACPTATEQTAVASRLEAAMLSFAVLDPEAFERAADESQALASCLAEPLTPAVASGLHRVRGMRFLLLGDRDQAQRSFVAALRADPAYVLPASVAPDGGDLAGLWAAARGAGPAPTAPLELGPGRAAWVDGHAGAPRPTIGPYWLQVQGATFETARVTEGPPDPASLPAPSAGLGPAAPPPTPAPVAPAPAAPAPVVDLEPEPVRQRHGAPLLAAGIGSGVVAAGLYGTAVAVRLGYDDAPTPSRYATINSTWLASVGTGAISASLLTAWLVTR